MAGLFDRGTSCLYFIKSLQNLFGTLVTRYFLTRFNCNARFNSFIKIGRQAFADRMKWDYNLLPAPPSCSYASWVCKSYNVPLPDHCGTPIVKILRVEMHRAAQLIIKTKNNVFSYEKFDDFGSQKCLPSTEVYLKGWKFYCLLIAYVELIYNRFVGSFHAQWIRSWFFFFNTKMQRLIVFIRRSTKPIVQL